MRFGVDSSVLRYDIRSSANTKSIFSSIVGRSLFSRVVSVGQRLYYKGLCGRSGMRFCSVCFLTSSQPISSGKPPVALIELIW